MLGKLKILIIDDEEDFGHFIKLNLERTGEFEVLVSTEGKQGIVLAKSHNPDLILLDIMMPEMDGTEIAEHLLDDTSTKDIPIVFLTALVKKGELKDKTGRIAGRYFIAKPVTSDELIAKIKSVLEKRS